MKAALLHKGFLWREIAHSWRHGIVFVLCVALSITTMAALNSFRDGVNRALFDDARDLHGADIMVHSHYELSPPLLTLVNELEREEEVISTMAYEFYSVVLPPGKEDTLFANIRVVGENYPLYGRVDLASTRQLHDSLQPGTAVVAEDVLIRLGMELGDELQVGSAVLRIVDIVTYESDSPVSMLNFGPRVLVSTADLERLDLVRKGSRVQYDLLLKVVDESRIDTIAERLKATSSADHERITTFRNAESRVKRFFDNLLFFLSLISIFTLLLAGLGMQSCLIALVRQKEKTIAITRTLGATGAFLFRHYMLMVIVLGLIGSLLGVLCGGLLGLYFPVLFEGFLPLNTGTTLEIGNLGESIGLGLLVVVLFTFLPLYRLRNIKPVAIFRNEKKQLEKGFVFYLAIFAGLVMVTLLVIQQLEDWNIGLSFMAGVAGLIAVTALLAGLLHAIGSRLAVKNLALRQALRSMTREGNATRSIIITLVAALSFLFAISLVERNLHLNYIESYPENAPNLFCLDIQPDQRQEFSSFFAEPPTLFPVIRARVTAINGTPVNRQEELQKKRDNFAREFNLTYRDTLLDDEVVKEGGSLFRKNGRGEVDLQVSVLDTVVEMGDLKLNDILLFNIQGVELEAKVTSIRTRTQSMLFPFFYFVFPEQYLREAPQTYFAAVQVEKGSIAALEARILKTFPNISFINVAEAAEEIGALMRRLAGIINFFASFSLLAGALILVNSILATRMARTRESVYYKISGAGSAFVSRVFIYENGLLGLVSALIALVLAHGGSWALSRFLFEIDYRPDLVPSLMLVGLTISTVVIVGLASSITIIRQKPGPFLRDNAND